MSHIIKVVPREAYRLEVLLDNGSMLVLNLESRLRTVRFGPLSDRVLFEQATTDGSFIRWGNRLEISVNEIFELAQK